MVVGMRARGTDGFDGSLATALNRRQLLGLAGTVSLATALGACSQQGEATGSPSSVNPSTPTPGPSSDAASTVPLEPPPTAAEVPGAPLAVTAPIICRDAWGAQPALPGGIPHTLTRMTIHHTAVVLGDNRNAPARLRQHQSLHQNERGWIDIAYHVSVDRNGNIYELRDPLIKGDTATEYDTTGHFLVLCEGNFDEETVTPEQLHGAAMAFAWAASTYAIDSNVIEAHRDYAATACPGADLYSHVQSGELVRSVNELLAVGPVNLQPLCGPAGLERVAAIEAGR